MASTNYYAKRDAKVNIANKLMELGWNVYGYKSDQSDIMTDYYSPADWDGVAEKNGYILVVDAWESKEPQPIQKYNPNYKDLSIEDNKRIEQLKMITVDRGATEGEEQNAKLLMEKIQNKTNNNTESRWIITGYIPAHMGSVKGRIWHLEKDGAIVLKGNSLTKFADIPESYIFDIDTMSFKEGCEYKNDYEYNEDTESYERVKKERTLSETEEKAVKAFKNFINKIEKVVNKSASMGDGTEETEIKAQQQEKEEKLEKVIERKVKTVYKIKKSENKTIKEGYIVRYSNGYYRITEIKGATFYGHKLVGGKNKPYRVSNAANSWYSFNLESFQRSLNNNYIDLYEEVTEEEIQEVEKWVKVKPSKKKTTKTEEKKEEVKENNTIDPTEEKTNNTVSVKFNEEKKGIELYFNTKPTREILNTLKANGFRWSKYNKCWYIKDSEEKRQFLVKMGYLTNSSSTEPELVDVVEKKIDSIEYEEININDIDNYIVPKDISDRENNNVLFRSKDINHTKQLQNYIKDYQERVIELLNNPNITKAMEYNIKVKLQSFKKKYSAAYVDYIDTKGKNPSWVVTGRGGLNANRYNKGQDRVDKKMQLLFNLESNFNKYLEKQTRELNKLSKEKNKSEVNNIDINNTSFKSVNIYIDMGAVRDIFKNPNTTRRAYTIDNNYYILKNWGSWWIVDNKGQEVWSSKTTDTLETAKKKLMWILEQEKKKVV